MSDRIELRVNGLVVYETAHAETDEQFVRRMYLTYERREPDPAGLAFWVGQCSAMTREQIEARFRPAPPVGPPPISSGPDLSDGAAHVFDFTAGVPRSFTFTHPGGNANVMLVTVGGSYSEKVWDTFPGLYENRETDPSGTDFRHEIVNLRLDPGTYGFTVKLDRSDRFMLQYWGTP